MGGPPRPAQRAGRFPLHEFGRWAIGTPSRRGHRYVLQCEHPALQLLGHPGRVTGVGGLPVLAMPAHVVR
eukprot:8038029-Lingulodinium_polyedra.AAC.1